MKWGVVALFVLSGLVSGCGNYSASTRQARDDFFSGKFADAAKSLEAGAHKEGPDQLLYLLDRATALHHAGDFEESIKDFHLADKISEIKDYTSLSTEAATLFSNEKIKPYVGEDFERVLISQYLALNYLFLDKYEDALVECRRVNHKLHLMITEGKRKYKLNPMARYLSAMMYEDRREWDHAYIDYQGVYELIPDFPNLREDLYRLAWKNKIREDAEKWATRFGLSEEDQKRIRETAAHSEIVVLVSNGVGPEKHPHPAWKAIPRFEPRLNSFEHAEVFLEGSARGRSLLLFNVERTAIENLDEKYGGIIAKKIAGVFAKEAVAHTVERNVDPLLGAVLRIGMHVADQADLRSWLTLPRDFQVLRLRVPPDAAYTVRVEPHDRSETRIGAAHERKIIFEGANAVGKKSRMSWVNVRI